MAEDKEVEAYIKCLHGECLGGRYKNTNLRYIRNGEKSVAERNRGGKPKNLNDTYELPAKRQTRRSQQQSTTRGNNSRVGVDPSFIQEIMNY